MESQQKKKTGKGSPSGKVWLAGAGPGDASLLTLKVKKWMDEADVIIYDALISAEILSLIPDGKEWIYVGKRSGHHCVRQEEINQILLREAKAGKNVLRLKGGPCKIERNAYFSDGDHCHGRNMPWTDPGGNG